MNREYRIGIIGMVIGALLTFCIIKSLPAKQTVTQNPIMSHKTMNETDMLQGKTGEGLEKAFLSEMITHHQGAIDMALLLKAGATHEEMKIMADDIMTIQSAEIEQMKQWQKDWGYIKEN